MMMKIFQVALKVLCAAKKPNFARVNAAAYMASDEDKGNKDF